MLYATWKREVSLHYHILCKDTEYIFPFPFPPSPLKIRDLILFSGITIVERTSFELLC